MEPTEERIRLIGAFRKFLNTPSGGRLDPACLIDDLLRAQIIQEKDAELLRSENSLPLRQFYLFLRILPSVERRLLVDSVEIVHNYDPDAAQEFVVAIDEAKRDGEAHEAGAEVIVKKRVVQVTVQVGSVQSGSAGEEIITPEVLEGSTDELIIDQECELKIDEVKVNQVIGRGGYAIVHLGVYDGQQVAVKKFHNYDTFALMMFKSEIEVMKKLNHPNIIKFLGYVRIVNDKQLWLLTEYINGGSMRRFCTGSEKTITMRKKLEISNKCWTGLAYLHSCNCCHKDISPDNILISGDLSSIKISDFGLAEFKVLMVTATTKATGTTMYQPPEFAFETGAIRHPIKSDVYALGASLCELFSGQWFWNLDGRPRNQWQVMCKLMQQRQNLDAKLSPEPEPDCWNAVPDVVKPILREAINPVYHQRKSANEMKQLIEELLQSVP